MTPTINNDDMMDDYPYDDDYFDYDEVYATCNTRGGGGGKTKLKKDTGTNVYSSRHTRLQAERKVLSKLKRRK